MTDLDARCANWGYVLRRRRSGKSVSLIWDGYYRAKSWNESAPQSLHVADVADAWIIEQAWADPRLFRLHRVCLAYHYVHRLDPRIACRLVRLHLKVKLRAHGWDKTLEQARDDLERVLEMRDKQLNSPFNPLPTAQILCIRQAQLGFT